MKANYQNTPANRVGHLIRERRHYLGFSQATLAKKLGLNSNFISEIENGKRRLPPSRISQFKKVLRIKGEILTVAFFQDFEEIRMAKNSWGAQTKLLNKKTLLKVNTAHVCSELEKAGASDEVSSTENA